MDPPLGRKVVTVSNSTRRRPYSKDSKVFKDLAAQKICRRTFRWVSLTAGAAGMIMGTVLMFLCSPVDSTKCIVVALDIHDDCGLDEVKVSVTPLRYNPVEASLGK